MAVVRPDCWAQFVLLLIAADTTAALVQNTTVPAVNNTLNVATARRNFHKKSASTSSESLAQRSDEDSDMSLGMSDSSSSTTSDDKPKPQSSEQRRGWRKWHRKCPPCPNDMVKKWRDRSISWICGGYQRARRSFKSECMMYYRNCQDGTMFVKIHDHRCKNDTGVEEMRHGLHFFYEYGKDSQDSSALSGSSELTWSGDSY